MTELNINALMTEVGVNMGDHAQDTTRAVVITPDMTIREVCEKYLTTQTWGWDNKLQASVPDARKYLTIRLAIEGRTDD